MMTFRGFVGRIRAFASKLKYSLIVANEFRKSKKFGRIIFVGIPTHGNLGDQALAVATRKFFAKYFPEKKVIEIRGMWLRSLGFPALFFKRKVLSDDVVVIIGGGFMGTLWINEEEMIRACIKAFPRNKIVIFPQTVFYEDSAWGRDELSKTIDLFRRHGNVNLFVRDESLKFAERAFFEAGLKSLECVPDTVLFCDFSKNRQDRSGVLFCLRKDKEKILDDDFFAGIKRFLRQKEIGFVETDTVVPKTILESGREAEVEKKLAEFRKAGIVITDRLHGMIFAVITGTPCIALNNSSKKVEGVFKLWIKDNFPYIKFVEHKDSVLPLLEAMPFDKIYSYDPQKFRFYWDKLAKSLELN